MEAASGWFDGALGDISRLGGLPDARIASGAAKHTTGADQRIAADQLMRESRGVPFRQRATGLEGGFQFGVKFDGEPLVAATANSMANRRQSGPP